MPMCTEGVTCASARHRILALTARALLGDLGPLDKIINIFWKGRKEATVHKSLNNDNLNYMLM